MPHLALRACCGRAAYPSRGSGASNAVPGRATAQALVELALVLPVMLLLLLGMVEFGRAYVAGIALEGAAREGARLASTILIPPGDGTCASTVSSTKWCTDVVTRVQEAAQPEILLGIGVGNTDVTICSATIAPPSPPPPCPATGGISVPTTSGQAITITTRTFKKFYVSFLTNNGIRWLGNGTGLQGTSIVASSTMRVP